MFMIAHHTEKFKLVFKEGLQEKMFSPKLNTLLDTLYCILKALHEIIHPVFSFLTFLERHALHSFRF